jgi:hypothetical protein
MPSYKNYLIGSESKTQAYPDYDHNDLTGHKIIEKIMVVSAAETLE